jgi:hypothetical protein
MAKREGGLEIAEVFDAIMKYGKICGNCAEIDSFVDFLLKKEEISRIQRLTKTLDRAFTPAELDRYVGIAVKGGWHPESVFWAIEKFNAKVTDDQVSDMLKSRGKLHYDQKDILEFMWIKKIVELSPTPSNVYLAIALCLNSRCNDWAKELLAKYDPSDKVRQNLVLLLPKLWAPQYQDEIAVWLRGRKLTSDENQALVSAELDNLDKKRVGRCVEKHSLK